MLKTAIIGISGYGKEHLRLLLHGHARGLMSPEAAVVINPEEVPEGIAELTARGCRIYDSVEAMWAAESGAIDLCMIPSAIATHFPFTCMAIEHGSHVFVEKPICATLQDAEELAALSERSGRQICVGFQDLYSPQVRELKARILHGDIGEVTALKGWGSWPRPTWYYTRNSWAGQLRVDGSWVLDSPLNNAMAHFLMLLLFWGGDTETGFAQPLALCGDMFRAQGITSFDTCSLRLQTRDGPPVYYAVTHSGRETVQPVLRVEGTAGFIEWSHSGKIHVKTAHGGENARYIGIDELRNGMIEQVCEWILHRTGRVVHAHDAALHTRIVNALHDTFPIRDFAPEQILEYRNGENHFHYVPGLTGRMEAGFEQLRLLSEVMPGLADEAPAPVQIADYAAFAGGYVADPLGV
jgi:predicted dehydrogenase